MALSKEICGSGDNAACGSSLWLSGVAACAADSAGCRNHSFAFSTLRNGRMAINFLKKLSSALMDTRYKNLFYFRGNGYIIAVNWNYAFSFAIIQLQICREN